MPRLQHVRGAAPPQCARATCGVRAFAPRRLRCVVVPAWGRRTGPVCNFIVFASSVAVVAEMMLSVSSLVTVMGLH